MSMWINRTVYQQQVEDARLDRARANLLEAELEAARAEVRALRDELKAQRDQLEDDRRALREAAVALHEHMSGRQGDAVTLGKQIAADAERALREQIAIRRQLEARIAVADANFGWCRTLVNMLQAERAALMGQRGIIVPTMTLTDPAAPAPSTPATGQGVPGEFRDEDALAAAMGVSFDDVGDEMARRLKLEPTDPLV